MKRLLKYLKDYQKESILAPLFKMLEALMDLLVPVIVARMINIGIAGKDQVFLLKETGLLVLLAAAGFGFSTAAQYFAARASAGAASRIRQAVFDHIQSLSYEKLDQLGTGTLLTRMTSDINTVQNGLNLALRLLLRSPFIVIGSMIMAFTINARCAMIFAVYIPLLLAAVFGLMLVTIPLYRKVQGALDRVMTLTRENLTGVRVLRAFCKESSNVEEFDHENRILTRLSEQVGNLSALLNPVTYILINIAAVQLIRTGAVQVSLGSLAQGDVVALYNYIAQMIVELIKLASLIITINRAMACADRVADVLDTKAGMQFPETTAAGVQTGGSVSFSHVTFSYSESPEASLQDISFDAAPGQTIGIIGGTGCGKSTLVNLIPRFYDATSGQVLVDGVDVRNYTEQDLIRRIGIVPQKAVLFAGTIRQNLMIGNESATEEDLRKALKTAQAQEIVDGKALGLEDPVEQGGRNLSGGQRQRLAIARALVRKPEILILDDSSSALDYATDARLRRALRQDERGITVFLVSQRASSIRHADQILVLEDGRIAGIGTHEQLMQRCPAYQEICSSQFPQEPAACMQDQGREALA